MDRNINLVMEEVCDVDDIDNGDDDDAGVTLLRLLPLIFLVTRLL